MMQDVISQNKENVRNKMLISVVIPLYNKEKSIEATIRSVFSQTYRDFELLVVNDGSTDRSAEVVRRLLADDERLRLIEQDNAGVSAARNKGIMEAKGEYVAFLDGDDLWNTDYLETLLALIQDYPNVGLYCVGYRAINTSNPPRQDQIDMYNKSPFRGLVKNPWSDDMDIYIGSTCCSKQRLTRVGMFDTRMTHGEDLDFCWRLILDGGMVRDNKCCAFYRIDAENRAMHKTPPLNKHIPYYIDKFSDAREQDIEFRRFFDRQMIYRLYPYLLDKQYSREACRIAKKFDYSQLKWSLHFRMFFPKTYYFLHKIRTKLSTQ